MSKYFGVKDDSDPQVRISADIWGAPSDENLIKKDRDFIKTLFETLPTIVSVYIKADLNIRKTISDWFFSIDLEALQSAEPQEEKVKEEKCCVMYKIGILEKRLCCGFCKIEVGQVLTQKMKNDFYANDIVTCPSCGAIVTKII